MGRPFETVFLLAWICGWAVGEGFALRQWFALWRVGGLSAFVDCTFFGLVGWTVAGLAAVHHVLRSFAGFDELWLRPQGISLRKGVGRFRYRRWLPYTELREFTVKNSQLSAETSDGTVLLTDLGSPADRQWLCNALRPLRWPSTPRLEAPILHRPEVPMPVPVAPLSLDPTEWVIRRAEEGGLLLGRPRQVRRQGVGILLFTTLFWNGVVGVFVAGGLGLISRDRFETPNEVGTSGYWLSLTPHLLVGLGMLACLLYAHLVTDERYVARNRLETHKRGLGREWRRASAPGYFTLDRSTHEGQTSYHLVLVARGSREHIDTGSTKSLRALGRFLAHHTGWQFRTSAADAEEE